MCGIFGAIKKADSPYTNKKLKPIIDDLLIISQERGLDSSGLALINDATLKVYKDSISAKRLIRTRTYKKLILDEMYDAVMGHARMETNGSFSVPYNNQPVMKDGAATIHNGIIVNDAEIWKKYKDIKRKYQVDTESMNSLYRRFLKKESNIVEAVKKSLKELDGSFATVTFFTDLNHVLLATNTGSLFILEDKKNGLVLFASEAPFIETIREKYFKNRRDVKVRQLKPYTAEFIELKTLNSTNFEFLKDKKYKIERGIKRNREMIEIDVERNIKRNVQLAYSNKSNDKNYEKVKKSIEIEFKKNSQKISRLQRCTRCVLPSTMPYIEFDEKGVCNYCHNYQKMKLEGRNALEKTVNKFKRKDGRPDSVVAFSGGRDSSYALHFVKKELGLHPVAFSYDWGMLTDLGRRNQARMTGKLGVEHILLSADIQFKRENIRKNFNAWLKRPRLGTVPLFMAGDKQYFYHLRRMREKMGIPLLIYSSNPLEATDFKAAFCGIKPAILEGTHLHQSIPMLSKLKMSLYYAKEYALNPSYINSTLLDSIGAFLSFYVIPHDYVYVFDHIKWDEKTVSKTLEKYDWELAEDTKTNWRIGDGTAPIYNYIYYTAAGFTENDTFRSNQIREGMIKRSDALKLMERDNLPRIDSMKWYCDVVNIDFKKVIDTIHNMKKLY